MFHLGVCCAMVQAKCLHQFVLLFLNSLIMGTAEEAAASDILVGAQPRGMCWTRARSSSSEVVDTATARRQQRVEDAARVGLQFPFHSERRGRGAPSDAMKWRDAVNAAIMHGPLPHSIHTAAGHRAYVRAFKSSVRQEVAKNFAEFFLDTESNFERANLDSSTSVFRQLLLSFVHTAAPNADSPQHRTAGWRFIDWNEVEQRELLAEAKNAFWRLENCFHEAQPTSLTRQMPRPKPPTASQRCT